MKRRALPMALTVVVAAAVVIGGLTFSRFVQESLWQESVTDVLEVTSQGRLICRSRLTASHISSSLRAMVFCVLRWLWRISCMVMVLAPWA